MPDMDDVKVLLEKLGTFVIDTAKDFGYVWDIYPNVIIWGGLAFLIAAIL